MLVQLLPDLASDVRSDMYEYVFRGSSRLGSCARRGIMALG